MYIFINNKQVISEVLKYNSELFELQKSVKNDLINNATRTKHVTALFV